MAECLRTRVRFPPSPPITKVSRFFGWPFLLADLVLKRARLRVRLNCQEQFRMCDFCTAPKGWVPRMGRIIPPSPPNNKTTLAVVFLFVDLARMRNRVPGSKKLSGTIFNVRLMHGPEGVSPMDGTNIPATKQKMHHSHFSAGLFYWWIWCWSGPAYGFD